MSQSYVIGVDVGGIKKGFHAAVLELGEDNVRALIHATTPEKLIQTLSTYSAPLVIAIDCPPVCQLAGPRTRLAERQLHRQGVRVQWTRRSTHEPPEWMENGQTLWHALASGFPYASLIECFPSVTAPHLGASGLKLPLALLGQHAQSRDWKDLVDACICADVAARFLDGLAEQVGVDPLTGEVDEIGLIYF